jgi:hypothetical protein
LSSEKKEKMKRLMLVVLLLSSPFLFAATETLTLVSGSNVCTSEPAPTYAFISASWRSTHCSLDATYFAIPGNSAPYAQCGAAGHLDDNYNCFDNKTCRTCTHKDWTANPSVTETLPGCTSPTPGWSYHVVGDI